MTSARNSTASVWLTSIDVLIYSETFEEHEIHVRQILKALRNAGLYVEPKKCRFHKASVKYLGLIITTESVQMDP